MSKFKNMKLRYKIGVGVASTAAIVAAGGAAFAYFTDSGSGTGQASVGNPGTWTVAQNGTASGAIYPGSGNSAVTFTITNTGAGAQAITSSSKLTAVIGHDSNGNVTAGGNAVSGCLATW